MVTESRQNIRQYTCGIAATSLAIMRALALLLAREILCDALCAVALCVLKMKKSTRKRPQKQRPIFSCTWIWHHGRSKHSALVANYSIFHRSCPFPLQYSNGNQTFNPRISTSTNHRRNYSRSNQTMVQSK